MVAKISKKTRVQRSPGRSFEWNGHFTIALCSLVLLMVSLAVIWEDLSYRKTRTESMKALLEWGGLDGQTYAKANLSASKKNEYRQSLKMAVGYLNQYKRAPEKNQSALALSQAQLKIALEQMDEPSKKGSMGKRVVKKLEEVEALMVSKGLTSEVVPEEKSEDAVEKNTVKKPSTTGGEVK